MPARTESGAYWLRKITATFQTLHNLCTIFTSRLVFKNVIRIWKRRDSERGAHAAYEPDMSVHTIMGSYSANLRAVLKKRSLDNKYIFILLCIEHLQVFDKNIQ